MRRYYHPYYASQAVLKMPVVFLGILGGIWAVSRLQWIQGPLAKMRVAMESGINFSVVQVHNYLGDSFETLEISGDTIMYVKYGIIAVTVFAAASSRSLFLTIVTGLFVGALFKQELSGIPFFTQLANDTSVIIQKLFSPFFN